MDPEDSKDSSSLQVVYDSADAKMQWRCHLYSMRHPVNLRFMALVFILCIFFAAVTAPLALAALAALTVMTFIQMHFTIESRAKMGPRICSTKIDEIGITDILPEREIKLAWKSIRAVEMSEGDIYFISPTGGSFIPATAFESQEKALEYFKTARNYWYASKSVGRNKSKLSSSNDKVPKIEDNMASGAVERLLAEEDQVWTRLEEEHKRMQGQSVKDSATGDTNKT